MGYNKSIVIDLDDTISFTTTRGWENAQPIVPTIEKIQDLFAQGWEIHIVTARGQLSCNGDSELAREKYETQIVKWLNSNNVPFTSLSFQKKLAMYYVDDKALRPDEFAELDIQQLSGKSGADVYRQGDRVYKTGGTVSARDASAWYKDVQAILTVPRVYSVIGDTICIEFIPKSTEHDLPFQKISDVFKIFSDLRSGSPRSHNANPAQSYVERLEKHFGKNNILTKDQEYRLEGSLSFLDFESETLSHGDFSLDNMILSACGKTYLIDPIPDANLPQTWKLDAAKLVMSLRKHGYDYLCKTVYDWYQNATCTPPQQLLALEITQWVRTVAYLSDPEKVQTIDTIRKLYTILETV